MKTAVQTMVLLLIAAFSVSYAAKDNTEVSSEKEKRIKTGWIGVVIQDLNQKTVQQYKLDSEEGAYVREVLDDGPADSAGVDEGDVIIEVNGKKISDSDDLAKTIRKSVPGVKINLTVINDSGKKTIEVTVGKKKGERRHIFNMTLPAPDVKVFLPGSIQGLRLMSLNEQLGQYFETPDKEGALVEEVEKGSAADKAGFKAGDVIIRVGKRNIGKAEKAIREIGKFDEGDKIDIGIIRKGARKTLNMEIEEQQNEENFFFHKPWMKMFRTDPFDDAGIEFEMNSSPRGLDHLKKEIEEFRSKWPDCKDRQRQTCTMNIITG